jgi:two-component system, OmpR family, phosphate regulon sensor histidine kinase PhoR
VRLRIRWKLLGSYLLLIVVMTGTLYAYLTHTLERYQTETARAGLTGEARLARLTAMREVRDMRRDAPDLASAIASEINARVTFISPQGEVLGDSDVKPDDLKELENHLNRPEVQAALNLGEGSSIRYSSTVQTHMLYVAFPFRSATGESGILRLALPLSTLKQARSSLHSILGLSLLIAAIISLALSYLLSSFTSRSLRAMATTALQFGKGDYGRRFPVRSNDELGELANTMNDMAVKIESQLTLLASEKQRLNTILRGMGEGVMVTNAEGIVTLVNPAFLGLLSIQEEVEGKPLIEITRHPALHDSYKMVLATRNERLEEVTLQTEQEKTVLIHWVPLIENNVLEGIVSVFHDISDLKRLEKIRRDFVANVSHELRTPVTIIKGYAETLLSGEISSNAERANRFVGIIHEHSERLANLIADLLSISEIESGELSLDLAPLRIEGVAKRVATLLEPKARAKGIRIDCTGLETAPSVLADHGRIEQVLVNLLDNAIKYTPENGAVIISARDERDKLRVSVTDTGIGIPANELSRVFERFYRVDKGRSRDEGGTGLGLSIVKHIVQLHGGTATVESTPGAGSTFSFTLKRA